MSENKTKVLFVCLGNICRSPTAEGICKNQIEKRDLLNKVEIDSAGTSAYHAGEEPDARSQLKEKEKGVDLSYIRSRQLILEDYYYYDYILAMDESNYTNIMDLYPDNATAKVQLMLDYHDCQDKNVPDPYWSGDDGFELVFNLLDTSVERFLDYIQTEA